MNTELFKQLGLDEREIKIYLELLKMGSSKAGQIAKRTSIDRSVVYKLLYRLINRSFVTYVIKENRKYFSAIPPEKILDIIKDRENQLKDMIPELKQMQLPLKKEVVVEIYKGKEGLKTGLNDMLKPKKDLYGIGYTAQSQTLIQYWYENWNKRRIKDKIKRFYLVAKGIEQKAGTKTPLTYVKVLPEGFEFPSSTIIYGGNVLIFFPEVDDITLIIIRSPEIAKSYKSFFDILWNMSKSKLMSF